MIRVRSARLEDEQTLALIDNETWTPDVSPAPAAAPDRPFFGSHTPVEDVLVATDSGLVLGYTKPHQPVPLASHAHVLEIDGLAVDPGRQRAGAGRALVKAAAAEARARGARKLSLRVLAPNQAARRLYESCGFVVEGVLIAEFLLNDRYVDDVLIAYDLAYAG